MHDYPPVFVVDDDPSVLDSLTVLLRSAGFEVRAFESAEAFLAIEIPETGCLVVDLKMPNIDGLELQRRLVERSAILPIIFITAYGEVAPAVEAMKLGAIDFIEKPYDDENLLAAIAHGLARSEEFRQTIQARQEAQSRLDSLSHREKDVLAKITLGYSNRAIGEQLGISQRTVEVHRANIMRRTDVQNLAELLHLVYQSGTSM